MRLRGALLVTMIAAIGLAGGVARADDEAASTELFNAGRDLMKQGDYAAACPKLAESVRLKATVGALAKLATCEEHEKRMVSAYTRWQQALNLARATGDERAPEVERELARVDKVVPKLTVKAAGALPADASIRVDDTTLGAASLGVPLPVEAGTHTVTATAAGKKPWSTTVTTAADGATTAVTVPILEDAPTPTPTPTPTSTPTSTPTPIPTSTSISTSIPTSTSASTSASASTSPWPTVGIVGAAAGLASIAGGAVLGFVAMGKRNDASCPNNTCVDAAHASTLNDAKTAADWSTGLFVAGGVLTAAGLTVWLVSHGHAATPVQVGAAVTPAGLSVFGGWD